MQTDSEYIERLKRLVEEAFAAPVKSTADFEKLHQLMLKNGHDAVSTSTLKRLWGYTQSYTTVRSCTLDVLCRFVGYPDWRTFVADYCEVESAQTSRRVYAATLLADALSVGQQVLVAWNPDRQLLLRHDGKGWFTVMQARNSKVKEGDTFHCERFMMGEPLYIDTLRHSRVSKEVSAAASAAAETITAFVLGKLGGLTRCELVQK